MKWVSTVSTEVSLPTAVKSAAATLRQQLGGAQPDLIIAFVSEHHAGTFELLAGVVAKEMGTCLLFGCSAGGVIGGGKEVEQRSGLSMTAAALPAVTLTPFHVEMEAVPQPEAEASAWERLVGVPTSTEPHFLLLPDPFTFDPEGFVRGLDRAYPGSRKVGGLASGGRQPGQNALFLGPNAYRSGLVGVALTGNIQVDTIVAQGCRPIGQPMFVTKCDDNFLWGLDGQPAIKVLQDLYNRLPHADQELAQHSLFIGIVMSEQQQEYRQGDFLIRNIMGTDPSRGALVVGARLRANSIVQFHLRDAKTSAEDLDHLLAAYAAGHPTARPQGALLFSCLGRGMHLYGHPDHDTDAFRQRLGDIPLGGFFCNGEIGPVHGATFLHGYTSAFGLFRDRRA